MILATHHFRGHVAGSATSVLIVVGPNDTCDAQVGESQVPFPVEHQVLRLDVSVDDAVLVQVVESENETCTEELGLVLVEASHLAGVEAEVSSREVVHDEVEVLLVLEGTLHVHDKVVLDLRQQVPFVHHRVHTLLHDHLRFQHLFHREHFLGLPVSHFPDFPETPPTDHVAEFEVLFRHDDSRSLFSPDFLFFQRSLVFLDAPDERG